MTSTAAGFAYKHLTHNGGKDTYAVLVSGDIEIGRVTRRRQTIRNTTHIVWYANNGGEQFSSRKDAVHAILYPEGSR